MLLLIRGEAEQRSLSLPARAEDLVSPCLGDDFTFVRADMFMDDHNKVTELKMTLTQRRPACGHLIILRVTLSEI
jgi:hypothetical protein